MEVILQRARLGPRGEGEAIGTALRRSTLPAAAILLAGAALRSPARRITARRSTSVSAVATAVLPARSLSPATTATRTARWRPLRGRFTRARPLLLLLLLLLLSPGGHLDVRPRGISAPGFRPTSRRGNGLLLLLLHTVGERCTRT